MKKKYFVIILLFFLLIIGIKGVQAQTLTKNLKVLVIELNPYLVSKGNIKASTYLNQDENAVITDLMDDIEYSSHGNIKVQIVKKEHLNEFPTYKKNIALKNGSSANRLDEETYLEIMKNGWYGWWDNQYVKNNISNYEYDYDYLTNKYNLLQRKNNNEFDEVWLVNIDPASTYESIMVGNSAYWINGKELIRNTQNFKIMNVSISRPDVNFECFGHAAEDILTKVFGSRYDSYNKNAFTVTNINELNLWERFTLNNYATPGYASVGNVHFAPNSTTDYDWQNKTMVKSSWRDWLNYPNLTGNTKDSNANDWVSYTNEAFSAARLHHRWWFSLMPHIEGRTKEGYSNNWWDYLFNGDFITNVSINKLIVNYNVNDHIKLDITLTYYTGNKKNIMLDDIPSTYNNININNENVVKVINGKLTAIDSGITTIIVYYDGKSDTYTINVKAKEEPQDESKVIKTNPKHSNGNIIIVESIISVILLIAIVVLVIKRTK